MIREAIGIAVAAGLLAGCGSTVLAPTSPYPMLSEAQECTRGGGWWRQNLGICDRQGTGVEIR